MARKRTTAAAPASLITDSSVETSGVDELVLADGSATLPTVVAARAGAAYARDPEVEAQIDQFAVLFPFPLDEFQREAIRTLIHGDSVMVAAPTGTGKALAIDTPVLTPSGWTAIGNLVPGDRVIGADGHPTVVSGVFPQGCRPAYRVTFTDGESVVCDLDHLWAVNTKWRRHKGKPWRVLTLGQILAEGLQDNEGRRHFIPMVRPVEFCSKDSGKRPFQTNLESTPLAVVRKATGLTQRQLAARSGVSQAAITAWETGRNRLSEPYKSILENALRTAGPRRRLDPYLVGLLIGDGGLSTDVVRFSSIDPEIIEAVKELIPSGTTIVPVGQGCDWIISSTRRRAFNPVIEGLRELGLMGKRAEGKFIPHIYKFASVADRIAVLQGLMDTDASISPRGDLEFCTVSSVLVEDVAFLVRSLGGRTRICTKETGFQRAFRLHVKLPNEIEPFRLPRKLSIYCSLLRKQPCRAIAVVDRVGESEMVCISVDAPDGLFVIDGFVVTHNTIVAEHGVYEATKRTGRVLYTTPIKALSNQKFRDLRAIYGDEVGLLTGDVSENHDARIVVMTTEVLRNMLLQTPWDLDEVDCVIFDEIHYLADPERGTTWEESIILCPEHVQLICLSATVSNADEIAAWISRTHRPIRLITHTERAVPLSLYYFVDGKLHQVVDHNGMQIRDFPRTGGEARRQNGRGSGGNRRLSEYDDPGMDEPQPREIIDALAAKDMLPAIYFLFSRNDCQTFAERLAVMRPHLVKPLQVKMIEATIATYLNALRPEDRELDQVRLITDLARKGIGFHHAGLLPILKQLVEVLFGRGLMEVVFATDTLALGVNMPARSVVIGRMSKWDGRRRRVLIPNEFQQMAGRAGRRGMDAFGHVIVPYSPWIAFRDMLEIGTGPLEPVRSAFAVRYNTVLNLWDPPNGERVRTMLQQSLAQFQTSQRIRQLEDDIIEIGGDIAGVPKGCLIGLDAGDELLEDYRNLNDTLTTAQQKERRLKSQLLEVQRAAIAPPWPEPGRQALRRAFRYAPIGLVAHHREFGWGVYLGRGRGGVGLLLFGRSIRLVAEYRHLDYLTDGKTVRVPDGLVDPPDPVDDVATLIAEDEIERIWSRVARLGLPELDTMVEAHRSRELDRVSGELEAMREQVADADAQVHELSTARHEHPCHLCPRRKEHRGYLQSIDRLEKERRALEGVLQREAEAEDARIRGVIRGIREVLSRFGYLYRGYPTAKADMLADVFDNDGLILCEMVDRGLLDRLAPEDLAEVFAWFSFDRDFRYANHFTLPDQLVLLRRRLEDLEHAVLGEERDNGLYISEGHNGTFYGAARAWCRGSTMAEIGEVIELSEGDLVLTFNKTIDLMRQVREMLADVAPENQLRHTLQEAERLLRRGIVEQSLKLGFAPIEAPAEPAPTNGHLAAEEESATAVAEPKKRKPRTPRSVATAEPEVAIVATAAKTRKPRTSRAKKAPVEPSETGTDGDSVPSGEAPAAKSRRRSTKQTRDSS